ncbi:coth protein-domain-containing protein [Pilobolus umbonatus]|nr:coth protein-domain-containing protein [Pilobolus umbonatus]
MKFTLAAISSSLLFVLTQTAAFQFNVIVPGATDVKVLVNGQQTALATSIPDVPFYQGEVDIGTATEYKYVVGGVEEAFTRALDNTQQSSLNDFHNRPVTYANIPALPYPIEKDPQWTRKAPPTGIWDPNYIPTVFITNDPVAMNDIIVNVPKTKLQSKLTFIGSNFVFNFDGVTFGLHGAGKKKNNKKQSWNWELKSGDSLGDRTFFKLRHMHEDPTQIRERLYTDVLHALGTYGNEANMIRLFINGEGFGTFNMLDDISKYSYVNAMFHNGVAPAQVGLLYDGMGGADFLYHPGNPDGYSSFAPAEGSPEGYVAIDALAKAFNETNVADDAAVAAFEQVFDVDQFFRFMVMEYLSAHWDGYWMGQTNDGAYKDNTINKWFFLGQDYDATFGVNLAVAEGAAFVGVSYKEFPTRYPGGILMNGLLKNAGKQAQFEKYLSETVRILFNNYTLTNRVLALHEFLLPDLEWDYGIVQRSPGIDYGWVFENAKQNLWQGVSGTTGLGGGAAWGLIEWINAKSLALAQELNIAIVTEPVYPPDYKVVVPAGTKSVPTQGGDVDGVKDTTSQGTSAAPKLVPATIAMVVVSALVSAML